jgi:fibronectin type 3 domain-containing protein
MSIRSLFLVSLLILSQLAHAQYPMAWAGKNGVFVQFSRELHGPAVVLERQETGSRAWQAVYAPGVAPASVAELSARMQTILPKNPIYNLPSDTLTTLLLNRFRQMPVTDSLYAFALNPLALEALGVGYFDTDVQPGHRYEYRLRPRTATTADNAGPVTKPVAFPAPAGIWRAKAVMAEGQNDRVRLRFVLQRPPALPGSVRVFRNIYAQTVPAEVPVRWGFRTGKRDSLFVEGWDDQAGRRFTYQYSILVADWLGNEGIMSDTVTVTNLRDLADLPSVRTVAARSLTKTDAVRLSWQLSKTTGLRSVQVQRSTVYDGPYTDIGSALPTDTAFTDSRVRPVVTYYYRLVLNGVYDKVTSVRFPGMLNAGRAANRPPARLRLNETPTTLTLRWDRTDADTRGYYVYQSPGYRSPLRQRGDILLSTDSTVTLTIEKNSLPPAPTYAFSVATVNTSYAVSPLSDTIYSGPVVPEKLATPVNLVAIRQDKGTKLVWQNMREVDRNVQGYSIFRRVDGEKEAKLIYQQQFADAARNTFTDTTVVPGVGYVYQVRSAGFGNVVSALSASTAYKLPLPGLPPPRGLKILPLDGTVRVLWDKPLLTGISAYKIYRFQPGETAVMVGTVGASATEFVDKTVQTGRAYFYQIATIGTANRESTASNPVGVEW